ncbi:hypothetical protein GGS23DRAFT_543534, partial [Durotheca rogersii]|uniref:uncharacterized protein n=1 Tax=Durotheca rogersii TaxID=419775 RepID=UPI002220D547
MPPPLYRPRTIHLAPRRRCGSDMVGARERQMGCDSFAGPDLFDHSHRSRSISSAKYHTTSSCSAANPSPSLPSSLFSFGALLLAPLSLFGQLRRPLRLSRQAFSLLFYFPPLFPFFLFPSHSLH